VSSQIEMVSLEELVSADHQYRQFIEIFDFSAITVELKSAEKDAAYKDYGVERLFKCLLLQFMENLSDRELQRFLRENTAAKYFCDFSLTESTPNFSVFSKIRTKIGTNRLSKIFAILRNQIKNRANQGFKHVLPKWWSSLC
jgi:transposase